MTDTNAGGPVISAVETVIDNGKFGTRTVKFETGLLARQAAGSVTAYLDDDTMLLSATTAGKHPKDHFDFFPLTIDVEERMYAAGQIPGSFFRSEGRGDANKIYPDGRERLSGIVNRVCAVNRGGGNLTAASSSVRRTVTSSI